MYLGFHLTEAGIKPGTDKLKAVAQTQPPANIHEIRQFLGLCNFFRTHVRNFAQVSAPLTALTRKDAVWKRGPLPDDALHAFRELQTILCSEPVVDYPRRDRPYSLITDAALGDEKKDGSLGAILTQTNKNGEHCVIAYASRKLQKHEKNYTPFLIEMQAAIWGMDHFSTYLRGRHFTLYTDHKPLEKLGKVHTRTLNRLQEIMNTFDFEIMYKKGSEMPADFLSRNAVDSINLDYDELAKQQVTDQCLKDLRNFLLHRQLPADENQRRIVYQMSTDCFLEHDVLWKRIKERTGPGRVVVLLPEVLVPVVLQEAHGQLLTGHDGVYKTKQRILQSYFWPSMDKDINSHLQKCQRCQFRRTDHPLPPQLLSPLPQCSEPNQRVHSDLFGPLKISEKGKKYILCITDAFTKYVELVALPDKEALTVTSAIFSRWICRYGIPLELITDQGREFNNQLSAELYRLLNLHHQTTAARHPQTNSQAEVANKTIAKYLNSFVNESTLDWEQYIAPLMFSYNTSFHRSVQNSPYFLTFGMEPRLPAFPAPDLRRQFSGNLPADEMFQRLQNARELAAENNMQATDKAKEYHDRKAKMHNFSTGQLVLLEEYYFLGKNPKLAPKFSGPHRIIQLKGTHNVEILLSSNKKRIVNVERLKPYFPPEASGPIDDHDFPNLQNSFPALTHETPSTPASDASKLDRPSTEEIPPSPTPSLPPTRKRGRPRKGTPLSLSHFQNQGEMREEIDEKKEKERERDEKVREGICTRSQARARAKQQNEGEVQVSSLTENEKVEGLKKQIKQKILILSKCCFCDNKNNTHTQLCKVKGKNWLSGDIYKTQDDDHNVFSQEEDQEEVEQELDDTEDDAGYGGSSPPHAHEEDEEEESDEPELPAIKEEEGEDSLPFHSADSDEILDYSALLQEASEAEDSFKEALKDAKTEEERKQIQQQSQEISDFFARKILGLEQEYREFNFAELNRPSSSTPDPKKKKKKLVQQLDKLIFGETSGASGTTRVTRSHGPVEDLPLPKTPAEYKKKK
jgi:hypothetical protein